MPTRAAQLVHEESEYAVVDVSVNSTTVANEPCILLGASVNTVLSAHDVPIQDGSTTVASLTASSAVGTNVTFPSIRLNTSLVVNPDDLATGSITVQFRRVNVTDIPL